MSLELALHSLDGLSIGDGYGSAMGEMSLGFSMDLPDPPWRWTDDTHMAISIVETLKEHGTIEQDWLAERFAERYVADPRRGYARQAQSVLRAIHDGVHWGKAAVMNHADGSYGNGAAMRAAPIGAFFATDPDRAVAEAALSAVITHQHPEGVAGAVAVAAATALNAGPVSMEPVEFIEAVAGYTPEGATRDGILLGRQFTSRQVAEAADALGVGWDVSAQDTVPFCVWVASQYPDRFVAAMMLTAAMLGDRDTTCAIVGGIVAPGSGELPADWLASREPLPEI